MNETELVALRKGWKDCRAIKDGMIRRNEYGSFALRNMDSLLNELELEHKKMEVVKSSKTMKEVRLGFANILLTVISQIGRKFFGHNGETSRLELDKMGRVWFVDSHSNKRIYTHHTRDRWKGFTQGGTLRCLIIGLRNYITNGEQPHPKTFGPWPDWYCNGDLWGYGDAMEKVRCVAQNLAIV